MSLLKTIRFVDQTQNQTEIIFPRKRHAHLGTQMNSVNYQFLKLKLRPWYSNVRYRLYNNLMCMDTFLETKNYLMITNLNF